MLRVRTRDYWWSHRPRDYGGPTDLGITGGGKPVIPQTYVGVTGGGTPIPQTYVGVTGWGKPVIPQTWGYWWRQAHRHTDLGIAGDAKLIIPQT